MLTGIGHHADVSRRQIAHYRPYRRGARQERAMVQLVNRANLVAFAMPRQLREVALRRAQLGAHVADRAVGAAL